MVNDYECNVCHQVLRKGEQNNIMLKYFDYGSTITFNYRLCTYHQEKVVKYIEKMIKEKL